MSENKEVIKEQVEETSSVEEQDLSELVNWESSDDDDEAELLSTDDNDDFVPTLEDIEKPNEKITEDKSEEDKETSSPEKEPALEQAESKPKVDVLQFKVNGEEKEMSLEDIRANYPEVLENLKAGVSGAIITHQKLTELDKREKAWYNEKAEVEKYISEFGAKVRDGHILGALEYFGQFAQLPAYVVKEQLIAALSPEYERRLGMTHDELRNEYLQTENSYLQTINESKTKASQLEQRQARLQETVNSVRETHSISESEWSETFNKLNDSLPQDQDITISMVVDSVLSSRQESQIKSKVDAAVSGHDLPSEFVSELEKVAKNNQEFTVDDLKYLVNKALEQAKPDPTAEKQKALAKELNNKLKTDVPQQKENEEEIDLSSLVRWDD